MTVTTRSMLLAQEAAGDGLGLFFLPLFLVAMYLLLIRPQSKRRKELQQLIASLKVGDLVATLGGLHGEVVAMEEGTLDLAVTEDAEGRPDVILRFDRGAVARVIEHADAGGGDDA